MGEALSPPSSVATTMHSLLADHPFPAAAAPQKPPKDVPPPTPVNLPNYLPRFAGRQGGGIDQADDNEGHIGSLKVPLVKLLRTIIRPADVSEKHFEALGVNVVPNVAIQELIPDTSVLPDFADWEAMDHARACDINQSTRVRICNGNMSPGVEIYQDRMRELSTPNEAAYRSVRRMKPVPGQFQARLGNSYEFFRNLEVVSTYWDDTSAVLAGKVLNPTATATATGEAAGQGTTPAGGNGQAKATEEVIFFRTGSGAQMPPEYRINVTNSFLKLVAYDFGCSVTGPRTEPRLYLNSPSMLAPTPDTNNDPKSTSVQDVAALSQSVPLSGPSSYFSSDCTFIFRTPRTREAARQGLCEGPVAAVSARHTTTFPPSDSTHSTLPIHPDSVVDLAREIVAALVTAQHRAREGRVERRIGKDSWWATKKRWGGGTGGPIGREVELSSATSTSTGSVEGGDRRSTGGSKERSRPAASLVEPTKSSVAGEEPARLGSDINSETGPNRKIGGPVVRASSPSSSPSPSASGRKSIYPTPHLTPRVRTKSRRTTLAIYDSYRMVRPPAAAWDPKTRYSPIGRIPGANFDDIFVVSALFHHISFLRVRVPTRLLEVLDGAPDNMDKDSTGGDKAHSWGGLNVYRTQWYDLFLADDRVAAMKVVWSMMAYLMRATDDGSGDDVKMTGT
ncbi:hypothetical protein PspLS_01240 [Pyricularia sp. CBS 133598]|nr:hypothetical protein PspLS_01240 [Pyricularia sp. CBS 133598]